MKKITNDKTTIQKLKLNRQTIAVLSTPQLGEVVGGSIFWSIHHRTCE